MIRLIFIILTLFFILIGLLNSSEWWWVLLPVFFIFFNIIFPKLFILAKNRTIYFIYFTISFLRYSFTPFLFILSGKEYHNYMLKSVSEESIKIACFFMIIELFVSMFFINLFSQKNLPLKIDRYKISNNNFLIFILIAIIGIFLAFPTLILRYNFILIPEEFIKPELDFSGSGIISILSDYILIIPPIISLSFFVKKYYTYYNKKYIYWVLLSLIPFLLFFKGISRFSALLPAIAWGITFIMIFPKFKKLIATIIMACALIVMISVSLFKQFGYHSGNQNELTINLAEIAITFNAYFAGLLNVAYTIELADIYNLPSGFTLLVNDFLKNLAFFSSFSETSNTSAYFFNNFIYSQSGQADQIIPIVGQSYLYFGYGGFFIFPLICILVMIFLEKRIYYISNINYLFPISLLAVNFSLSMMVSLNSLYPSFFNFILPLLVILKVNELISRVHLK